jgi:ABC-type multidrug transport system fused ATPase/permease subunit
MLARLVASTTTKDLALIAGLNNRASDEPQTIMQDVTLLRSRVATNTRLVAHLRDITTPLFVARADYATRKFDSFIKLSGVQLTLDNAEADLRAVNLFLQHHDASLTQSLSKDEQRQTDIVSLLFSAFGVALALITVPSFLVDLETSRLGQTLDELGEMNGWRVSPTTIIELLTAALLAITSVWLFRKVHPVWQRVRQSQQYLDSAVASNDSNNKQSEN